MKIININQLMTYVAAISLSVFINGANANDMSHNHGSLSDFFSAANGKVVTSSDNFQQIENIISEISLIRHTMKLQGYSLDETGPLQKQLLQVLIESVVMQEDSLDSEKFTDAARVHIPNVGVNREAQRKVFKSTEKILVVLKTLKGKLGIKRTISNIRYIDGKEPQQVYENTWLALNMANLLSDTSNMELTGMNVKSTIACSEGICTKVNAPLHVANHSAKVAM